jgi:hypothetical protein
MARLRKREVNGHVLPLLLFLRDGWGWEQILPTLVDGVKRSWAIDRPALNQPSRVQTVEDLIDNAQQGEEWCKLPHPQAVRSARTWLHSLIWYGEPAAGSTMAPFVTQTVPDVLNVRLGPQEKIKLEELAHHIEEKRADLHLSAHDLADWVTTLDATSVERGRLWFRQGIHILRQQSQDGGNPLTLGGKSRAEITVDLRAQRGRPTAAHLLGWCIVQAMVAATLAEGVSLDR